MLTKTTISDLMLPLRTTHWDNPELFLDTTSKILNKFYHDQKFLSQVLDYVIEADLLKNSGSSLFLSRIRIFRDDKGYDLSLHHFNENLVDEPHDHRSAFATIVLSGGYNNYLYCKKNINKKVKSIDDLNCLMVNNISPGKMQFLGLDMVHKIQTMPDTITMVIRGPEQKSEYFNIDPESNTAVYYKGGYSRYGKESKLPPKLSLGGYNKILDILSTQGLYIGNYHKSQ